MFRSPLRALVPVGIVLALAALFVLPSLLLGQLPDTAKPLADTLTHVPPVVTAPPGTVSGLAVFLATYAIPLATLFGSGLLWVASHAIPAIANLGATAWGDWIKRGLLVAGDWIVIEILHLIGGSAPTALTDAVGSFGGSLIQALAAAVVGGTIFNLAGTTPPKTA